jgi:hypothetical protein
VKTVILIVTREHEAKANALRVNPADVCRYCVVALAWQEALADPRATWGFLKGRDTSGVQYEDCGRILSERIRRWDSGESFFDTDEDSISVELTEV